MGILGASNPAPGTGKSLNYIGNHAYANSGFASFDNTATTLLEFVTGSGYVTAHILAMRNDSDGLDSSHRIYIDNELVGAIPISAGANALGGQPVIILLVPYSRVKIDVINTANTSTGQGGVSITGRIYQ